MFPFTIFLSTLLSLLFARLFLNWIRLRSIPGPFVASLSDLWRFFYMEKGTFREKLFQLHQKHGSMVRYGVNAVSFSDPEVINTIYASRTTFTTAKSYRVLTAVSNGKEVYSLIPSPEEMHTRLRRSVAQAFSPTASLEYEGYFDDTIQDLLIAMEKAKVFDFSTMAVYYSMDAGGRFAFSQTLGCLESQSDAKGMIGAVRDRFKHWGRWGHLPDLEHILFKNPIALRSSVGKPPTGLAALAMSRMQERQNSLDRQETHHDLLQKFLEGSRKYPNELTPTGILGMILSTISGAGDTTGSTITAFFYYILKHPSTMKKLQAELSEASLSAIPKYAEVKNLRYLDATIKEVMRLMPLLNMPIEREVPAGGATLAGRYFAAGTIVGCQISAVHSSKTVFGEDAEAFRPERWIEADTETLRQMENAHLGFSRGKRVCIGQHLAVMSMKKSIPAILGKFKLSLVDPNAKLDADYSAAAVAMRPLMMKVDEVLA